MTDGAQGGVTVNIGNKGGKLDNSPIKFGNIAGMDQINIEAPTPPDPRDAMIQRLYEELNEAKQRIRTIEQYIAGSALGEPGLTIQIKELKAELKRVDAAALDTRIANIEALLLQYTRNNVSIDKYVFMAVVALLFLAIPAVFLFLWLAGR